MAEESQSYLVKIYQSIIGIKEKYGRLRKTLFHLHTPYSHDFRLTNKWKPEKYLSASDAEIEAYCERENVFPKGFPIKGVEIPINRQELYSNKKQWLSFMALASALVTESYELVVVSDHNRIGAASLLRKAIDDVKKYNADKPYTEVLAGVEISCADKLHVIGIYDENKEEIIQKWLEEGLVSEIEGTFYTSLQVLEFFHKHGQIAYIAHLNTSPFFAEQKFLNGAYKKKMISEGAFNLVGVTSKDSIPSLKKKTQAAKIETINFVIDNDSHSCEGVKENYFWIKASKLSFQSLHEALEDCDVSVYLHNNQAKKNYIVGILIEKNNSSFLIGENDSEFKMRFSDSLNCFIGGRGTGKSTVLQLIDFSLSTRVDDERMLEFLCKHGNVWILFYSPEAEYLIEMALPDKGEFNNILCRYGQNQANEYWHRYYFNQEEITKHARAYQSIYKINHNRSGICIEKLTVAKATSIEKLYDTRYSVNRLVRTAESDEINTFIYNLMFKNKNIVSARSVIKARSMNGLSKLINRVEETLEERKQSIEKELRLYNKEQNGLLKIVYTQDKVPREPDIQGWLRKGRRTKHDNQDQNITLENAIEYMYFVYNKEGVLNLLQIAFKSSDARRYKYSIKDFLKRPELSTEAEERNIIDSVYEALISHENMGEIIDYLKDYVRDIEELSLLFNVNSKTGYNRKPIYKDVRQVSLGQKVVAMLDFILSYGTYIGDNRPLLLDQPEDNLDNQYIYKNLVQQLREVKSSRQIIIATHSATVVTNAMTDQVCVMLSDGEHGWIEKSGYPSEPAIKKHIINYLEGGTDSFKHKQKLYKSVL